MAVNKELETGNKISQKRYKFGYLGDAGVQNAHG